MKIEAKNIFKVLEVDEEDSADEIGEIHGIDDDDGDDVGEVVEVTVDSGAGRSVWPKTKGGVTRKKIKGKVPKLVAANGTEIEVAGEAVLEFDRQGKRCSMKFLDADVKKPLEAISAMNDEGNTVVFSKKWGNFVERDEKGERIPLERRGGTFVMVMNSAEKDVMAKGGGGGGNERGKGGVARMEVGAADEELVFRRRVF